MSLTNEWDSKLDLSGFDGSLPERIYYRKTDCDYETVPRAIYTDFIADMKFREEGYSGKWNQKPITQLEPLYHDSVEDSLSFLCRVPCSDPEKEQEQNLAHQSQSTIDNQEQVQTRTVVLTEWGIDILNFSIQDLIPPLDKPKIKSPLEYPVHFLNPRGTFTAFDHPIRYSSWLNQEAVTPKYLMEKVKNTFAEIEKTKKRTLSSIVLRYKRKFVVHPNYVKKRGLSFRARGHLDMRMGWAHRCEFDGVDFSGDITESKFNDHDDPISFNKDVIDIKLGMLQAKSSMKHIPALPPGEIRLRTASVSSTSTLLKKMDSKVNKELFENYQKAPSLSKNINSNLGDGMVNMKEDDISTQVISVEENIPIVEVNPPKRQSILKSLGEANGIKEQLGMIVSPTVNNTIKPLEKNVSKLQFLDEASEQEEKGTISIKTAEELIPKRFSRKKVSPAESEKTKMEKELSEFDSEHEDDAWIKEQKKNLFGNWREPSQQDTKVPGNEKKISEISEHASFAAPIQPLGRFDTPEEVQSWNNVIIEKKKPLMTTSRLEVLVRQNTLKKIQADDVATIPANDIPSENIEVSTNTKRIDSKVSEASDASSSPKLNEFDVKKFISPHQDALFDEAKIKWDHPSFKETNFSSAPKSLGEEIISDQSFTETVPKKLSQLPDSSKTLSRLERLLEKEDNAVATIASPIPETKMMDSKEMAASVESTKESEKTETKPNPLSRLERLLQAQKAKSESTESVDTNIVDINPQHSIRMESEGIVNTNTVSPSKANSSRSISIVIDLKNSNEDLTKPSIETSNASLIKSASEPKLKPDEYMESKSYKSNTSESIPKQLQEDTLFSERKPSMESVKSDNDVLKKRKGFFSSISSSLHKSKSNVSESDQKSERNQEREHQQIHAIEKERKKSISSSSIRISLTKTKIAPEILKKEESAFDINLQKTGINQSWNSVVSKENKTSAADQKFKKNDQSAPSKDVWEVAKNKSVQLGEDSTLKEKTTPKIINGETKVDKKKIETFVEEKKDSENPQVATVETVPKKSRFLNAMDMQAIEAIASQNAPKNKLSQPVLPEKLSETEIKVKSEEKIKANLPTAPTSQPPVSKIDPDSWLRKLQTVTWKDHKCEVKIIDFEFHANEVGKSKPYKDYLPINLRRIIGLEIENSSNVIISCCLPRKEKKGGEQKKITLMFNESSVAKEWRDNMIEMIFGGTYQQSLKREILLLAEKSDKEATKLIGKFMTEVFDAAKRTYKLEVVQYNEFSVSNVLEKYDFSKIGNVVCTNESFLPRLQQVLVRLQLSNNPVNLICETDPVDAAIDIIRSSIGKNKEHMLHVSAVNLKREENKLLGFFNKK